MIMVGVLKNSKTPNQLRLNPNLQLKTPTATMKCSGSILQIAHQCIKNQQQKCDDNDRWLEILSNTKGGPNMMFLNAKNKFWGPFKKSRASTHSRSASAALCRFHGSFSMVSAVFRNLGSQDESHLAGKTGGPGKVKLIINSSQVIIVHQFM